jgi:hypothetical protein
LNGANSIVDLLGAARVGRWGTAVLLHGETEYAANDIRWRKNTGDVGPRRSGGDRGLEDANPTKSPRGRGGVWCGDGGEGSRWQSELPWGRGCVEGVSGATEMSSRPARDPVSVAAVLVV